MRAYYIQDYKPLVIDVMRKRGELDISKKELANQIGIGYETLNNIICSITGKYTNGKPTTKIKHDTYTVIKEWLDEQEEQPWE